MTQGVDGEQRSYTATGLRCGTLHHFYLTAHNYIGERERERERERESTYIHT